MNDGGPAFPMYDSFNESLQEGMSLRNYFAVKALGLGGEFFHNFGNGCNTPETIAQAVYQIADAMLAQRLKETP